MFFIKPFLALNCLTPTVLECVAGSQQQEWMYIYKKNEADQTNIKYFVFLLFLAD